MTDTITVTGTVESIDPMHAGTVAGVTIGHAGRRSSYVRVTLGGHDLLERIAGARASGESVTLSCSPIPPRLGAPLGEVVAVLPHAA
jgi:hypothetical protein